MLKQDHIHRLVRQLAEIFSRLLRRLRDVGPAEVEEEVDRTLRELSGLSIGLVNTLSLRGLLEVLGSGKQGDVARSLAVAELLYLHGLTRSAQGDEAGARMARVRSLTFYLDALPSLSSDGLDEPRARADELIDLLHDDDLPEETMSRLLHYHEASGRFARAEDALFEMIDRGLGGEGALADGVTFYERLLELEDGVLETGNLPRDEVEEGLEIVRRRRAGS